MSFDYFEDLEDFELPALSTESASDARAAILESLEEYGLDIPAAELSEEELQALPGHVLIGWKYDNDMSLSLFAVPESALSSELAAALALADGSAFAYHELMIGDDNSKAFARLDAATGGGDFDDYLEDFEEQVAGFGETVAASDRSCLAAHRVAFFEDDEEPVISDGALDKRFAAAFSFRRCQ